MTGSSNLTDAFAELERQADHRSAQWNGDITALTATASGRSRAPLVAASVVGVAAATVGVTVLVSNGGSSSTPAASAPKASGSAAASSVRPTPASSGFDIPATPAELSRRFRTVLGDTATFRVTYGDTEGGGAPASSSTPVRAGGPDEPSAPVSAISAPSGGAPTSGAVIVGTLTASGVTGGFDLQIFPADKGDVAFCEDPGMSKCHVTRRPDGSSIALGHETLDNNPKGLTRSVVLVRTDGAEVIMHVSNERDPKGESKLLAPKPPLTSDQMAAIVSSDRW